MLSFILYFILSTFIITSYACECETTLKWLNLDIYTPGESCGSYCTYSPKIFHYNRWNSNNTELIVPPIACTGGYYSYQTYPAQGTLSFECISRCCTIAKVACLVQSEVITKPRVPCDQTGVNVKIPCVAYRLGC